MKNIFLLILCFAASIFTKTNAQLFAPPAAESSALSFSNTTAKATVDFMQALRADTYIKTSSKEKAALLTKLSQTTTASEVGEALVSLSKLIKGNKLKNGFNASVFVKKAASITTTNQANKMLLNLESGLTPDAFNSIWKMQRPNWLNEVKK